MKLKIICDSTASLANDYIEKNNIEIVALNVIIDGHSYKDSIDIDMYETMERFYKGAKVTSSQPSPLEFVDAFNRAKEAGYSDVLCFTISHTLSGTFNAANLAKSEVFGINIHIVDTLSASIGSEIIIHEALSFLQSHSLTATLEHIEVLKANAVILLNMENLTAAKKSGRMSRIKAAIGNLLRVKPIMEYIGGKLSVITKFKTEAQVFNYILERIGVEYHKVKSNLIIYLSHVRSLERIEKLKDFLESKFADIKVRISKEISPVVAINIGYGGYGIGWTYS